MFEIKLEENQNLEVNNFEVEILEVDIFEVDIPDQRLGVFDLQIWRGFSVGFFRGSAR